MDDKKIIFKKRFGTFLAFLFVWLFFGGIGLFFALPHIFERNNCTEKVTAVVVKVDTDYRYNNGEHHTYHYPTVKYEYNGVTYTTKVNYSSSLSTNSLRVDDVINIYVNPKNPNEISLELANKDITVGLIILYICIGLELLNLLLFILDIRNISLGKDLIVY